MKKKNDDKLEFPLNEIVEDFAGRRKFVIDLYEPSVGGFLLIAKEDLNSDDSNGYQFESYSEFNPVLALGKLRKKINKSLSIKYLEKTNGKLHPKHDELVGRIGYGGVIVEGIFIEFEDVSEMLQTYEGFQFKLTIAEPSADII